MMGRQTSDQGALFYEFRLEDRVPEHHLLRRINTVIAPVFVGLHQNLSSYYSSTGRPSIDPELMIRMLIIGYCYGIRSERRLCEEVALNLAYRWFCRLDLNDTVPDHSSFSKNRHGRFRESDLLRQIFEAVVRACMAAGLVKGEGFAVDARRGWCGSIYQRSRPRLRIRAARRPMCSRPLIPPQPGPPRRICRCSSPTVSII
jgi:transposase